MNISMNMVYVLIVENQGEKLPHKLTAVQIGIRLNFNPRAHKMEGMNMLQATENSAVSIVVNQSRDRRLYANKNTKILHHKQNPKHHREQCKNFHNDISKIYLFLNN